MERLFDPYTGEDLGDAFTRGERAVLWTVLTARRAALPAAGVGIGMVSRAAVVTVLCLTGAVVWWPGYATLAAQSLRSNRRAGGGASPWDLHSAIGAWAVPLHPHVGSVRLLHGSSRAFHGARRLHLRSESGPARRPARRSGAGVAEPPSFRPLAEQFAQGIVGRHRAGTGRHVRDRPDHVGGIASCAGSLRGTSPSRGSPNRSRRPSALTLFRDRFEL